MYERIKYWYEIGAWPEYRVRAAVKAGRITEKEYREITGKEYQEA